MRTSLALAAAAPFALAPLLVAPAQAQSIVKLKQLQKEIQRGYKTDLNIRVVAKCPKQVIWAKGKTFTCKVTHASGTKGTVLVTLKGGPAKGRLTWERV